MTTPTTEGRLSGPWPLAGRLIVGASSVMLVSDLLVLLAGLAGVSWFPALLPWLGWKTALCQLVLLVAAWRLVRGPGRGQFAAEVALGLCAARWLVLGLGQIPGLPSAEGWAPLLGALLHVALAVAVWRRLRRCTRLAPVLVVIVALATPLAWALWLVHTLASGVPEGLAVWLMLLLAVLSRGGLVILGAWLVRDCSPRGSAG